MGAHNFPKTQIYIVCKFEYFKAIKNIFIIQSAAGIYSELSQSQYNSITSNSLEVVSLMQSQLSRIKN